MPEEVHTYVLELNRRLRRTLHPVEGGGYTTALDTVKSRSGPDA